MATVLDAQIGYAEEVTYGTRIVPVRFLEFDEEDLAAELQTIESDGLRKGQAVQRTDRRIRNKIGAGGSVTHEVMNKGFGLLFKHAFGTYTHTQPNVGPDPTVWRGEALLGDPVGRSLTAQVGRPDVGGNVIAYDYLGCKVTEFELMQELDAILKLKLGLDAQDEKDTEALATAAYPAAQTPFQWKDCAVTVDGAAVDMTKASFKYAPKLKTDRRFLRANVLKKNPLRDAKSAAEGALAGEFEGVTAYRRAVNGTIVPIVMTWTGALISGAFNFKIALTLAACQFDGEAPKVGGPGVLEQPLPFTVLDNGTDPAAKLEYFTTDAAA